MSTDHESVVNRSVSGGLPQDPKRLVAIRERTEAAAERHVDCDMGDGGGPCETCLAIRELREDVPWLLAIAEAARSLHAGLTCEQDPMDVDERIARLGAALAVSVPVGEGER